MNFAERLPLTVKNLFLELNHKLSFVGGVPCIHGTTLRWHQPNDTENALAWSMSLLKNKILTNFQNFEWKIRRKSSINLEIFDAVTLIEYDCLYMVIAIHDAPIS